MTLKDTKRRENSGLNLEGNTLDRQSMLPWNNRDYLRRKSNDQRSKDQITRGCCSKEKKRSSEGKKRSSEGKMRSSEGKMSSKNQSSREKNRSEENSWSRSCKSKIDRDKKRNENTSDSWNQLGKNRLKSKSV